MKKFLKHILPFAICLLPFLAFAQPGSLSQSVYRSRVNDSTASISANTSFHTSGYADLWWNNQASPAGWRMWDGTQYVDPLGALRTADNLLTVNPAGNVQAGGTAIQNTSFDLDGFDFEFSNGGNPILSLSETAGATNVVFTPTGVSGGVRITPVTDQQTSVFLVEDNLGTDIINVIDGVTASANIASFVPANGTVIIGATTSPTTNYLAIKSRNAFATHSLFLAENSAGADLFSLATGTSSTGSIIANPLGATGVFRITPNTANNAQFFLIEEDGGADVFSIGETAGATTVTIQGQTNNVRTLVNENPGILQVIDDDGNPILQIGENIGGQDFLVSWAPHSFTATATTPAITLNTVAADPSSPANGSLWYNSTLGTLRTRNAGVNVSLPGAGGGGLTTADNLLTVNPAGNVQAGGTAIQNTTFDMDSFEFLTRAGTVNDEGSIYVSETDVFMSIFSPTENTTMSVQPGTATIRSNDNLTDVSEIIVTTPRIDVTSSGDITIGANVELELQGDEVNITGDTQIELLTSTGIIVLDFNNNNDQWTFNGSNGEVQGSWDSGNGTVSMTSSGIDWTHLSGTRWQHTFTSGSYFAFEDGSSVEFAMANSEFFQITDAQQVVLANSPLLVDDIAAPAAQTYMVTVDDTGLFSSQAISGGGGITNGAAVDEIPVTVDGSGNLDASGVFSATAGNITMGSASIAGNRTLAMQSTDGTTDLNIVTEGVGSQILMTVNGSGAPYNVQVVNGGIQTTAALSVRSTTNTLTLQSGNNDNINIAPTSGLTSGTGGSVIVAGATVTTTANGGNAQLIGGSISASGSGDPGDAYVKGGEDLVAGEIIGNVVFSAPLAVAIDFEGGEGIQVMYNATTEPTASIDDAVAIYSFDTDTGSGDLSTLAIRQEQPVDTVVTPVSQGFLPLIINGSVYYIEVFQ